MSTLYCAQGTDRTNSRLSTIAPSDGSIVNVNGLTGEAYGGLAFDFTDGTLYGATTLGSPNGNNLVTLDPVAGTIIAYIGAFGLSGSGAIQDIVCDNTGVLYGLSDGPEGVCTIDKTTGAATSLGGDYTIPPGNVAGGLCFTGARLLALSGESGTGNIYVINRVTGNGTLLVPLSGYSTGSPGAEVDAASIGDDGLIYAFVCLFDMSNPDVDFVSIGLDGVVSLIRTGVFGRGQDALAWDVAPNPYTPIPPPARVYARVYGIDITLSDDGVEQVSRLVTSPDGFTV